MFYLMYIFVSCKIFFKIHVIFHLAWTRVYSISIEITIVQRSVIVISEVKEHQNITYQIMRFSRMPFESIFKYMNQRKNWVAKQSKRKTRVHIIFWVLFRKKYYFKIQNLSVRFLKFNQINSFTNLWIGIIVHILNRSKKSNACS